MTKHIISWWSRQTQTVTVKPKWWEPWRKATTYQKSEWVKHSYSISNDLMEYLLADHQRIVELIESFFGKHPIHGLQIESGFRASPYVPTSTSEDNSDD